jgi:hypothetical protein
MLNRLRETLLTELQVPNALACPEEVVHFLC